LVGGLPIKKMSSQDPESTNTYFEDHFSLLKEPRRTYKGNFVYPLEEILFLTSTAFHNYA